MNAPPGLAYLALVLRGPAPDRRGRILLILRRRAPARSVKVVPCVLLAAALGMVPAPAAQQPPSTAASQAAPAESAGQHGFEVHCAGCHGLDGRGGEHAPAIATPSAAGSFEDEGLFQVIHGGIPSKGMPAFNSLSDQEIHAIIAYVRELTGKNPSSPPAGNAARGAQWFFGKAACGQCHMLHGRGGFIASDLTNFAASHSAHDLRRAILDPDQWIPKSQFPVTVILTSQQRIFGQIRNEDNFSLQVQSPDGAFHLLPNRIVARVERAAHSLMPGDYRTRLQPEEIDDLINFIFAAPEIPVISARAASPTASSKADFSPQRLLVSPPAQDWASYNGDYTGRRYTALNQIGPSNVGGLRAQWVFHPASPAVMEATPVVVDGVMYVTAANNAFALDARTGRVLWSYRRPVTQGLIDDASAHHNRGVAVWHTRVFMETDNAHLLCLDARSGHLIWDVAYADTRQNYGATSAPLIVRDKVLVGTSGGDDGVRGFLAAFDPVTGKEVWRFWTIPAPGAAGSESWPGDAYLHGGGTTWMPGTYDPETNTLFWGTGNPSPDFAGEMRPGDDLYTDCVLALDPDTGRLKWHFQFTPHDLSDYDAVETPVLIDATLAGRPRKLLAQANRNGYFYLLDRTTGKFLRATPFLDDVNWATGIDAKGRPIRTGLQPTPEGAKICPSFAGATNWMSPSFNPSTGLFYFMALDDCTVFIAGREAQNFRAGETFYNTGAKRAPGKSAQKILMALDLATGKAAWRYPQVGDGQSWGGTLATASGLVFFGDDADGFEAVDARQGQPLWHFNTGQAMHASPMAYGVNGRQYIAIAAANDVFCFALPAD